MERQKAFTIKNKISRVRVTFPTDFYKKSKYNYELVIDYYFDKSICGIEVVTEKFYLVNKVNGDIVPLKATEHNYK